MKVILTCDHVLERTAEVEILETVAELFEGADIQTLAHRPRQVLGPLELRKIKSTFLSNLAKDPRDLMNWSFLAPQAIRALPITCSADLVVNISSGLSHAFPVCKDTKLVTYLFRPWEKSDHPSLRERFFASYLEAFSANSLARPDLLLTSSEINKKWIADRAGRKDVEVLPPGIHLNDYKPFPKGLLHQDKILIVAEGASPDVLQKAYKELTGAGHKVFFIGADDHLDALKKDVGEKHFLGDKCAGEMAPIIGQSHYVIDLARSGLPSWPLKAMAVGIPVLSLRDGRLAKLLDHAEGPHWCLDLASLLGEAKKPSEVSEELAKRLRGIALQFQEVRFKHEIKRYIAKMLA